MTLAKQAVNRAFETTLSEGVRAERALFLSLFGTADQREGMAAFVEKRRASFGAAVRAASLTRCATVPITRVPECRPRV